jgi:hypothetical protein
MAFMASVIFVQYSAAQVGTVLGAPNTCAHTFYIDFSTGNDAAGGTRANPWKRHPYMTGWSGSYTHTAGDCFIFKGGVTWDHTAMPLYTQAGGTSGAAPDYYGVDVTWYTGGSWTRPIFDCQSTLGCNTNIQDAGGINNITWDSLEIRGIWCAANVNCWNFYSSGDANTNLVVNNINAHNWRMSHTWSSDAQVGGLFFCCDTGAGAGSVVQNSLIHNEDGGYMASGDGSIQIAGAGGEAISRVQNVIFNEIHDTTTALLHGGMLVHDNYIHDGVSSWDPSWHTNGLYADSWQQNAITLPQYIYRNKIINWKANAAPIYPNPCYFSSQAGGTRQFTFTTIS